MVELAKYFTKSFLFKFVTVVIGVVDIGLTGSSYCTIYTENPFLSVICILFILSFVFLIGVSCGIFPDTHCLRRFEISYHVVGCLLLFMTGSVFFFSVVGNQGTEQQCHGWNGNYLAKRYLAAIFGLINGVMYGLVSWNLLDIKIVSRSPA